MIRRLAWVTAREAIGLDPDEALAVPALRRAGAEVDVVVWDDPAVAWASYDRAVLRSTWDYPQRLEAFLPWLASVSSLTDLRNPLPMVRWSLDKHYLAELDAAGVPITPTTYLEPTSHPEPTSVQPRERTFCLPAERGGERDRTFFPAGGFVVKPAVGAGSKDAASYGPDDHAAAEAHVRRLHAAGATALVQPLLTSVAEEGEWPLVFFGSEYSHAARKRVALPHAGLVDGLFAEETNTPYVAQPEQIAVAQAAVDLVTRRFGFPFYARVDLVRGDDGHFCVLEVELVEPSLFLPEGPPSAIARLVEALLR